jgi:TPR repeat protein
MNPGNATPCAVLAALPVPYLPRMRLLVSALAIALAVQVGGFARAATSDDADAAVDGAARPSSSIAAAGDVSADLTDGESWVRKAAEAGDADAQALVGLAYLTGVGVVRDFAAAERWLRRAARQDNAYGQIGLARLHAGGFGVTRDPAEAVRLLLLAAGQGNADGQAALGNLCVFLARDFETGLKWLRLAVAGDSVDGRLGLAYMLANGIGIAQDRDAAMQITTRAAEDGDAEAQYRAGRMHELGTGAPANAEEAARWYRLAFAQDHVWAMIRLANLLERGRPDDRKAAQALYAKALAIGQQDARSGDPTAQRIVGHMHEHGLGVPQDDDAAADWYRKAAEQDEALAQIDLALLYEAGRGVEHSPIEALKWLNVAESAPLGTVYRETWSAARKRLRSSAATEQVLEAERLAKAWTQARGPRVTCPEP